MLECKHVLPFFHQRAVCRPLYVSMAFMELLRILAKENERKLPYF